MRLALCYTPVQPVTVASRPGGLKCTHSNTNEAIAVAGIAGISQPNGIVGVAEHGNIIAIQYEHPLGDQPCQPVPIPDAGAGASVGNAGVGDTSASPPPRPTA